MQAGPSYPGHIFGNADILANGRSGSDNHLTTKKGRFIVNYLKCLQINRPNLGGIKLNVEI